MASILSLPFDILEDIAEMSTWGCLPLIRTALGSYARNHAALARTCRGMYEILNEPLYKRNLKRDPHRASCVLWAAEFGRLDTMKRAVQYGANLSSNGLDDDLDKDLDWTTNQGHYTALYAAIFSGHGAIVDYLIDQDIDFNVPTQGCCDSEDHRCYPLHLGFQRHDINLQQKSKPYIEALIKRGACLFSKETPLQPHDLVVFRFSEDMVFDALEDAEEPDRLAAFHYAVCAGRHNLAKAILRKYPDFDLSVPVSDKIPWAGGKLTILHYAMLVCKEDHSLLEVLLDRPELDANMETGDGDTLLLLAADVGTIETAKILLQRPEIEYRANKLGVTPLHRAVTHSKEMVKLILEVPGVDVGAVTVRGETVLHYALEHQRKKTNPKAEEELPDVIQMLLDHPDIDPLAVNVEGESALQYACGHKRADLALLLLKDPRIKAAPAQGSKDQCTLLFTIGIEEGSVEVMRELLATRPEIINIDAQDEVGATALHAACSRHGIVGTSSFGNTHTPPCFKEDHIMELVQCLVNGGASTDLADQWGNTPLRYAVHNGLFRIASWLLSKGSTPLLPSSMLDAAFIRYHGSGSFGLYIEIVKALAAHSIAVDVMDLPLPELSWLSQDMETLTTFLNGVPDLGLAGRSSSSGDVLSMGNYLDDFEAIDYPLKPEWVAFLLDAGARLDIPINYPDGDSESMASAYLRTLGISYEPLALDLDRMYLVVAPLIKAGAWCGPEGNMPSALELACQKDIRLLEVMAKVMTEKNVDGEHVRRLITEYEVEDDNVVGLLKGLEKRLDLGE